MSEGLNSIGLNSVWENETGGIGGRDMGSEGRGRRAVRGGGGGQ